MICNICKKDYQHLGSHLWHAHKIKAREYKIANGLPINFPLIDDDLSKRISDNTKNSPSYKENFKKSKKYQFKKGHTQNKNRYRSPYEMARVIATIKKYNNQEPEACPICKSIYKNLDSHLLQKHKLIRVK